METVELSVPCNSLGSHCNCVFTLLLCIYYTGGNMHNDILNFKIDLTLKGKANHSSNPPGLRLNIKTVISRYGDSHVKDKTVGETALSLTWESLY